MAVPKLSAEQERTIREVLAEADDFGASPMERLAAIQTIGVEANYGNPNYGDRDSLGPFQQRASWGSAQQRRNPRVAARKFFETARQMRQAKKYTTAGALAADVQRPAEQFRGRYQQRRSEALAILQHFDGSGSTQRGGSGGSSLATALRGPGQEFDSSRGMVSGLEMPTAASVPVSAPVAGPSTPAGYGPQQTPGYGQGAPSAGAPQAPAPVDLGQPQDYSQGLGQEQQQGQEQQGEVQPQAVNGKTSGAKPRVKIAGGANAAGRPLSRAVLNVLDEISSQADREITVTTGTNHDKYTVNGNVSEHFTGHGADVAAVGKDLTDQATDALLATARGKKIQWLRNDGRAISTRVTAANARKIVEAGGIFNIPHGDGGRIQLIANTHQGGDHTNHWHVGVREG